MQQIDTRNDDFSFIVTTPHGDIQIDGLEFYGAALESQGRTDLDDRQKSIAALRSTATPQDAVARLTDAQAWAVATRVVRAMERAGKD